MSFDDPLTDDFTDFVEHVVGVNHRHEELVFDVNIMLEEREVEKEDKVVRTFELAISDRYAIWIESSVWLMRPDQLDRERRT